MYNSIFRYLNLKGYEHNKKTSELFRPSREVVSSKMKELKQIGTGNKPFAAQPFTTEDIAMMCKKNILGLGELVIPLYSDSIQCYHHLKVYL